MGMYLAKFCQFEGMHSAEFICMLLIYSEIPKATTKPMVSKR